MLPLVHRCVLLTIVHRHQARGTVGSLSRLMFTHPRVKPGPVNLSSVLFCKAKTRYQIYSFAARPVKVVPVPTEWL